MRLRGLAHNAAASGGRGDGGHGRLTIQTLLSWGARIEQEERGTYRLVDKDWIFPAVELERDELMA
ncbi:MAG: hypothetical protein RL095_4223, partial [Verrucomicrobiota bacterium]